MILKWIRKHFRVTKELHGHNFLTRQPDPKTGRLVTWMTPLLVALIFPNLVGYIERGEIKPIVANQYPLRDIAAAQEEFLAKKHVGKIVLIPPVT